MNNLKSLHKIESRFYWSHVCAPRRVLLFVNSWTVAWQALRSMEFSRLEILELVAISFSIYWCTLKLIEFCTVHLQKNTKFSMKRNTYFERKKIHQIGNLKKYYKYNKIQKIA